jgi:hypothetical protein
MSPEPPMRQITQRGAKKCAAVCRPAVSFRMGAYQRNDDSEPSHAFPTQTSGIFARWSATQRPIIVEMPRSTLTINDL